MGYVLSGFGFESSETSVPRMQVVETSEMENIAYFTVEWSSNNVSFVRRFSGFSFRSRMG